MYIFCTVFFLKILGKTTLKHDTENNTIKVLFQKTVHFLYVQFAHVFCGSWGFGHKGQQQYFSLYPLLSNSIDLQHSKATPKQHQNNTKSEPQSEQQQDRARAIITYRCYMNKTVNRLYIFQPFFPSFAQKYKNGYERDTFHNLNRDMNHPHPFTVIQITLFLWYCITILKYHFVCGIIQTT